MHTNILSSIRKSHFTSQLFVALMVNMTIFSQPLSYALNSKNSTYVKPIYTGSLNSFKDLNEDVVQQQKSNENNNETQISIVEKEDSLNGSNVIFAFEKQGIIGKSENLPIDEPGDNIFSFELKQSFKQDKDAYLEYDLFGIADASHATKSINDQMATGGCVVKSNKVWTKVRERLNPSDIQKGVNYVKFTTSENADYQYMVRNLKMVYENKVINESIVFNQSIVSSYNGTIALSGYVTDKNIKKISVLGDDYPVINGVFEIVLQERLPNASVLVSYEDTSGIIRKSAINIKQLLDKPDFVSKSKTEFIQINKIFEKGIKNSLILSGAKLEIEDLSLENSTLFSIAGLRYRDVPTLSPEMVNVTADFYGYRMLPHGNHFTLKPAKLHLKYDEKKLPTGYTAKDIKTFYFDIDQRKWLALEKDTLLSTTQEIVSKTTHFTDFINGIIKVPESPETGSYTPTSIKDIKAADPTAGVVSIAPPSPNNMGTLNTSFPIKLPAGRGGMQPELSINYSSEGGNGWMGLGWDLAIPGVSIDTRWGAPRYGDIDGNGSFDNKETEIYSMGGGMLTLKDGADYTNPHRKDNINSTAERQFYPRTEGSYAKIIRHGSNPTNYWWEVTDKTGNKSFYGGYGNAVVDNSVIRTAAGNIAYWGLYRKEDTNKNYVQYNYDNQVANIASNAPGNGGNEFYIKEIKYTLHNTLGNNPPNYYKVSFTRDRLVKSRTSLSLYDRKDIQINARNGVVQVTKDFLKEIKIEFINNQSINPKIRTYKFDYEEHIFMKSQLYKVSEYDSSGDLFYSNTIEYYDKDEEGNAINESNFIDTNESQLWDNNFDDIKGDLLLSGISNEFSNKGSALGATKGWGINGGLYVGFGIPCSGSNLFTVGVNGGFSYSESNGLVTFMDVNGDGLPDKIYKKGNDIKFRPNLGSIGSNLGFDSPKDITGFDELSETMSILKV